jgi:hypothetical protein
VTKRRVAVTAVVSAMVVVAALVAAVLTGPLDLRGLVTGSAERPCVAADTSMNETIARMFALMATDADRIARCWTPGEADLAVLSTLIAAGTPATYDLDNEHSRGRDGVLYSAVRVRASWAGSPPPGWGGPEMQIVMRQHRDWSWTIDTIQPRNRAAMSDPHCGVCHR